LPIFIGSSYPALLNGIKKNGLYNYKLPAIGFKSMLISGGYSFRTIIFLNCCYPNNKNALDGLMMHGISELVIGSFSTKG
jgi:hypothetical protein